MSRWWLVLCAASIAAHAPSAPAQAAPPAAAIIPTSPSTPATRTVRFDVRTLPGDAMRVGPREPATLVAIFATWCRSCKEEVATLNQLQREFAARNVRVLAINIDKDTPDAVRRWLDGLGATYPAALDESGTVSHALGAVGVPEFYLVSNAGRVVFTRRGPIKSAIPALQKAVAELGSNQ